MAGEHGLLFALIFDLRGLYLAVEFVFNSFKTKNYTWLS